MPEFLRFTLRAPIASMGDIAVGERRYSANRPAKSQIIGLLGAALGIERIDEDAHRALDAGLAMATTVIGSPPSMTDFQTTQTPRARTGKHKGQSWPTRAGELRHDSINTILSWRDYLQDMHAEIALWPRTPTDLEACANALNRPAFNLYFGRKSCPLSQPPNARILKAETLPGAFDDLFAGPANAATATLFADTDAETLCNEPWSILRRHIRRDRIHRRRGWMFGEREELVLSRASDTRGVPA